MRSNRPELVKQTTDVLDEIIPAIPVDDRTLALVARIGECILKAAAKEQASYKTLLAAASAENGRYLERENKPVFYLTEDGPGKAATNLQQRSLAVIRLQANRVNARRGLCV
jgi:hypothetical protein